MRWGACLVLGCVSGLMGCGLTLDLTPPVDGGAVDAARRDAAPRVDADAPDALRFDGGPAEAAMPCTGHDECFIPDCIIRECEMGRCVVRTAIACAPIDDCHYFPGTCSRDGTCDQVLIDEDGDMHASLALGACGDDCDDGDPSVSTGGGVCAPDLDGDGYGSKIEFTLYCGDAECPDGWVRDRRDCWDDDVAGRDPGPDIANPDATGFFFQPLGSDGSFDWDCDGVITKNLDDNMFVSCEGSDDSAACRAQSGWLDEIPDCGDEAARVLCLWDPELGVCGEGSRGFTRRGCR